MSLPKPRQRYPPFTFLNVYIHRKSTIYLACVRSTPSHFLNSHSAVVTDHLCEVTLSWALSHGVFIPSCIFSKQQHRIIHFLINGPPPAIYRKQISLVRDNLILLSQSHAINTTLRKHKYKTKSFKEQPPPTPQSAVSSPKHHHKSLPVPLLPAPTANSLITRIHRQHANGPKLVPPDPPKTLFPTTLP